MDFQKIEKKWQNRWKKKKIFEPELGKPKKFFFTVPYPYISGSLHIGHGRVVVEGDIYTRYKRMAGFNVLYPMAFHITGTPVLGISMAIAEGDEKKIELYKSYVRNYVKDEKRVSEVVESFREPWNIVKFFIPKMKDEFSALGLAVDWTRSFTSGDIEHKKMVEWQFKKYKEKDYLTKGSYPVLYCTICENAVGEDDITDADINPVEKQEFVWLKFKMPGFENRYLAAATLRPETVFGQTNLWINPEAKHVLIEISGEEWIISREAAEKLKYQKELGIKEEVAAEELIGKWVDAPGINRKIIVLPSGFVDPDFASGIVTSVPSDAPYDYIALEDLKKDEQLIEKYDLNKEEIQKIEVIPIIETEEYGDMAAVKVSKDMGIKDQKDSRLEEATKLVYKIGFHTGKMVKNCGKYNGMGVSKAKDMVKDELVSSKMAELIFSPSRTAKCRCGGEVIVSLLKDQWFIDFNAGNWKELAGECLAKMQIQPEHYRQQFINTFEWLDKRPCARRRGIGTPLPFNRNWIIESLSDSTIYMSLYTIKNLIAKFKIKGSQLTPEFFNYVYLGEGGVEKLGKSLKLDAGKLKELRDSFDYWYPNDHRHTYTAHLSNHLSFFIFAHAGIFPEKYWPGKISFHGFVMSEGSKMSKSKGNVITLLDVKEKFGADVFRAYMATATSTEGTFDWRTSEAVNMQKTLANLFEVLKKVGKAKKGDQISVAGKAFLSKFESSLKKATKAIDSMNLRDYANIVIYEMLNHYRKFQRRASKKELGAVNSRISEKWIKAIAPVVPHITEELWHKSGKKTFVSAESWPDADDSLIDAKLEAGDDYIYSLVSDVQEIIKLIKKKPGTITVFIADAWKNEMIRIIQKNLEKGNRDFKSILSELMELKEVKKHGNEVSKILPRLLKDPSKMPEVMLGAETELMILKGAKKFLEKEFGCKFKIAGEGKSKEEKAKQALPGKPSILLR